MSADPLDHKGSFNMISTYQRLKRQRDAGEINGFTLIELLIVIVVLGILAAVVIFALGGITGKSALSACQADGATVATAISAFNAQNPADAGAASIADLTGSVIGVGEVNAGSGDGGPYISSWPSNGTNYTFTLAAGVLTLNAPKAAGAATYTGPQSCVTQNVGT
jgi:prepilin-type N-terminal cleavage/methylation domain-containing protein